MSSQRYSLELKDEAVRQLSDRGHPVTEVAQRLGVSSHSLYKWVMAVKPDKTEENAAELVEAKSAILKLRAQLRSTEEERIKKRTYKTRGLARADIFNYIDIFYNRVRRHTNLSGVLPEAFERASF